MVNGLSSSTHILRSTEHTVDAVHEHIMPFNIGCFLFGKQQHRQFAVLAPGQTTSRDKGRAHTINT